MRRGLGDGTGDGVGRKLQLSSNQLRRDALVCQAFAATQIACICVSAHLALEIVVSLGWADDANCSLLHGLVMNFIMTSTHVHNSLRYMHTVPMLKACKAFPPP